jgi:hypothetical protein
LTLDGSVPILGLLAAHDPSQSGRRKRRMRSGSSSCLDKNVNSVHLLRTLNLFWSVLLGHGDHPQTPNKDRPHHSAVPVVWGARRAVR